MAQFYKKIFASRLVSIISIWFGTVMIGTTIFLSFTTMQNDREIDSVFTRVSVCVDAFIKQNNRLPNEEEFISIRDSLRSDNYYIRIVSLHSVSTKIPKKAIILYGNPPEGGYVLSLWRGEWEEYYASWSTPNTNPGTIFNFVLPMVGIGLVFIIGGYIIFRRSKVLL